MYHYIRSRASEIDHCLILASAFVYVKRRVQFKGPPSDSYLAAIRLMLEEAGHPVDVAINFIDDAGALTSLPSLNDPMIID